MDRMKLYLITCESGNAFVWAETDIQAHELFAKENPDQMVSKTVLLMQATTKPFSTKANLNNRWNK